ncbi:MAG: DUF488 domain-containing protein [Alphaproteobacteria bacterium]|nr:DUF488 domain-containing protein [Alphaproteobacteria bacterium]
MIKLYTIGFENKSADEFFSLLKKAGVKSLIDIRLKNTNSKYGYASKKELYKCLAYYKIDYKHKIECAPSIEIFENIKRGNAPFSVRWEKYETDYIDLIKQRDIIDIFKDINLNNACLMCYEDKPKYCHRRLLAEYLQKYFTDIEIVHFS